jgi:hypothetical protein
MRDFLAACRTTLDGIWEDISSRGAAGALTPPLQDPLLTSAIRDCLISPTKTYHYVLPTQLLAKVVNPALDAHCLQTTCDSPGAFDARTIAHEVIVPFDQTNYRVLGGSAEPYVNNPVRVPSLSASFRPQQKNKADWDKLIQVVDYVEARDQPTFTALVFEHVLFEIYRLLADVVVVFPTPNRISLKQTQELVTAYLAEGSGGERLEAVCTALFQTISEHFGVFDQIKRTKVNAADASTRMLADIECWSEDKIVLLVEVKDRALTLVQLDAKLDAVRSRHISELLFLAQEAPAASERQALEMRVSSEYAAGQNVYVTNFTDFALGICILLGEKGRAAFIDQVGKELDRDGANIVHRRRWATLLKSI